MLIANSWLQENKILLQSLGEKKIFKKIYLLKKLTKKCKRGHFSPINPADIMPEKSVHASTEEQLAVTQLCPQHSKGSVSTGGSYSSLMCMKKVGLGAPPGTVLPPEIHYGGLACLQSLSRSQLKQAFVLNWFLCRSLAWSGT